MKKILSLITLGLLHSQLQAQVSFSLSASPTVGNVPSLVTAADVNSDGKADLIVANQGNATLSVLTNTGNGGFTLASSPIVGNGPRWVVAADVNGDGKVDLVSANYSAGSGNSLSVLTNNGNGGFLLASSPALASTPFSVLAVDVNGDGKVDLVSANTDSTLTILTNNGSGGFVLASSPSLGGNPRSATAFTNVDGKVDLVSANQYDNTLSLMTNNGSGGFALAALLTGGSQPLEVAAADVNGDGKVDLISANYGDNTLSVWTNNGSGGFALSTSPTVGSLPFFVTAADVNGDRKVDLICANYGDNTLTVVTNNGKGGFVFAATLAVGYNPLCVTAADVNGDGKMDLISANSGNNTLSIWLNTTPFPASPQNATGTAIISYGYVVSVTVDNGGFDYTNTPSVRLVGGGGSGAGAVAAVSNGVVTSITVTNVGSGYTSPPQVVIDPPYIASPVLRLAPMSFLAFSNLTLGGAYQLQQFASWYWSNLPVNFTATNALYTQMVPGVAGSGSYRLALNPVPAQAFATAVVNYGFVVHANLTSGGSGYVTSPAVSITDGGGTNAAAVAQISGGVVTNLLITNPGTGYTSAPTIKIGPPPAAAVSAVVSPVMRLDAAILAPYQNYQIQFKPDLGQPWETWNGGLFSPTDVTNSQYLFITNGTGFFRLQYVQ